MFNLKSKTFWTGLTMIALGIVGLRWPDIVSGIGLATDPTVLIGTGFGLIGIRHAIKKGTGA